MESHKALSLGSWNVFYFVPETPNVEIIIIIITGWLAGRRITIYTTISGLIEGQPSLRSMRAAMFQRRRRPMSRHFRSDGLRKWLLITICAQSSRRGLYLEGAA